MNLFHPAASRGHPAPAYAIFLRLLTKNDWCGALGRHKRPSVYPHGSASGFARLIARQIYLWCNVDLPAYLALAKTACPGIDACPAAGAF